MSTHNQKHILRPQFLKALETACLMFFPHSLTARKNPDANGAVMQIVTKFATRLGNKSAQKPISNISLILQKLITWHQRQGYP